MDTPEEPTIPIEMGPGDLFRLVIERMTKTIHAIPLICNSIYLHNTDPDNRVQDPEQVKVGMIELWHELYASLLIGVAAVTSEHHPDDATSETPERQEEAKQQMRQLSSLFRTVAVPLSCLFDAMKMERPNVLKDPAVVRMMFSDQTLADAVALSQEVQHVQVNTASDVYQIAVKIASRGD